MSIVVVSIVPTTDVPHLLLHFHSWRVRGGGQVSPHVDHRLRSNIKAREEARQKGEKMCQKASFELLSFQIKTADLINIHLKTAMGYLQKCVCAARSHHVIRHTSLISPQPSSLPEPEAEAAPAPTAPTDLSTPPSPTTALLTSSSATPCHFSLSSFPLSALASPTSS